METTLEQEFKIKLKRGISKKLATKTDSKEAYVSQCLCGGHTDGPKSKMIRSLALSKKYKGYYQILSRAINHKTEVRLNTIVSSTNNVPSEEIDDMFKKWVEENNLICEVGITNDLKK